MFVLQETSGRFKIEKEFADAWERENRPEPGPGYTGNLLQGLFTNGIPPHEELISEITDRDRMIAATVIQWLG